MLRNKLIAIFLIIFLSIPICALADQKIDLKCSQADNYVMCNISGNTDYELIAFDADISYSSNLELLKFINNDIWLGDASNNKLGLYSLGTGDINNFDIGSLQFKIENNMGDEVFVSLDNVKISGEDYKWIELEGVSSKLNVKYSSIVENEHTSNTFQLILIVCGVLFVLSLLFIIFLYCIKHINDNSKIYIKRKQLIVVLSSFLIIIILIYFFTNFKSNLFNNEKINYVCNDHNEILQCRLYGKSNYDITAIELEFDTKSKIEITNSYEWQKYFDNNKLDLFSSYDKINDFDICEFKIYDYKSNEKNILKNITFIDKDGYNHLIDDINIKYERK